MFHEFFVKSPLLAFPLASLALFSSIFVLAVAYVLGRGRELEARATIPLTDERGHE